MSCTFDLISLPDSIPLRRYRLSNLDLVQLATGYKSAELPIPEPGKLGVDLTDFEFSYSDAAWQRFREKLSLINDYYAASALVDTLLNQREMYDPMSVRNLPGTYVFLLEVNKIVNLLDEKKLPDRLELDSYDPQDYTKKFSALFRFSRSASMTFGQELPKMDSVPWNGNLELLTKQYIRHLMRYVTHSLLLNGIRSNLYDEYLIRYFEIPAFENDQTTFLTLVQKMYPYLNRERTATMITGKIRDAYLLEASQLINQSSFAEALARWRIL